MEVKLNFETIWNKLRDEHRQILFELALDLIMEGYNNGEKKEDEEPEELPQAASNGQRRGRGHSRKAVPINCDGTTYPSIKVACESYNISPNEVHNYARDHNVTKERAFNAVIRHRGLNKVKPLTETAAPVTMTVGGERLRSH